MKHPARAALALLFYFKGLAVDKFALLGVVPVFHRPEITDDAAVNFARLSLSFDWTHIFLF